MTLYRYKAVDGNGAIVEGQMEADSERVVVSRLQSNGLLPLRARPAGTDSLRDLLSMDLMPARRGLSQRQLALLTRELATLLQAGVELEKALDILVSLAENEAVRRLAGAVLEDVRGGGTLADALARHSESFPRLYINMVRAGEAGATLDAVFDRLAGYLEQTVAARSEVRSAMIYPAVLVFMALASVFLLIGFVLPRFKPLFEGAGAKLPLATRIVMAVGEALETYGWLLALALLLAWLLTRLSLRTETGRLRWDRGLLDVPVLGGILYRLDTARFARTLGTLLTNGVPMLDALSIAAETIGNSAFRRDLASLGPAVGAGRRLADEVDALDRFPLLGARLLRVGEETGQLEAMLLKIADIYDREVQQAVSRALALFTPALTIVLGLLIAGIISSILLAILSINEIAF
jgi:general secretion pathway protein F